VLQLLLETVLRLEPHHLASHPPRLQIRYQHLDLNKRTINYTTT